jgi:hypothetical protein
VVQHLDGRAVGDDAAGAHQDGARAEGAHGRRVVRDEEDGRAALLYLLDAAQAAVLEDRVADGERLVDDEDVGLDVGGDGEGEADEHPRRVGLDRLVDERPDLGEALDLGEEPLGLAPREPHQRRVHVDVLDARALRVEARPELEERRHAPLAPDAPAGRLERPGDDLQQRRLAAPVRPDDPRRRPRLDLEAHPPQRPELAVALDAPARQRLLQPVARPRVDAVLLRHVFHAQRHCHGRQFNRAGKAKARRSAAAGAPDPPPGESARAAGGGPRRARRAPRIGAGSRRRGGPDTPALRRAKAV